MKVGFAAVVEVLFNVACVGFILDKKIGVNQPKRVENANILIANTRKIPSCRRSFTDLILTFLRSHGH